MMGQAVIEMTTTWSLEPPSRDPGYERTRARHVADALAMMPANLARVGWSRPQIMAERQSRLRGLLRVAKAQSPWHASRLSSVDPDTFEEEDLDGLPVMTKADAMANWDEIVTDPRLTLDLANRHIESLRSDAYLLDRYHVVASGGTSGTRGVFPWGWDGWAWVYLAGTRYSMIDLIEAGKRAGVPPVIAAVWAEHPAHMSSSAAQTFSTPRVRTERMAVTLPLEEIIERLNRLQPTMLMAYASVLGELADAAGEGLLKIAPIRIASNAEVLRPEVRARVEARWPVVVANGYATSEAGYIGSGCGRGAGIHLAEDLVIVETVDDDGRPTRPGRGSSRIFITNLVNPVFPLIRYEIGDQVTLLDDPCPCGSAHRRIADIEGRTDDVFVYDGGVRVHPLVFDTVLDPIASIRDFKVTQTPSGALVEIEVTAQVDTAAIAAAVASALRRQGLQDADVGVREVDKVGRSASGKLARFVPLARGFAR